MRKLQELNQILKISKFSLIKCRVFAKAKLERENKQLETSIKSKNSV